MSSSLAAISSASLATTEGALVSVSIHIDPRYLEVLLEALARIDFPINPQIYHDAEIVRPRLPPSSNFPPMLGGSKTCIARSVRTRSATMPSR